MYTESPDKFNPYEARGPQELSAKLRKDLSDKIEGITISEHSKSGDVEAGTRSDVFFVDYPIENDMHFRSVVKIPNEDEYSVASIHNEANIYQFLTDKVDCIPMLLGYNNVAEILHTAYAYSEYPDYQSLDELAQDRPIDVMVAVLESVQQLHKLGVIHHDIIQFTNAALIDRPDGSLKAILYDLASADIYSNPETNKDFQSYRLTELEMVVSLLPINVERNNGHETTIADLVQLGISDDVAEKILLLSTPFNNINVSIEEVDEIIDDLKKVSTQKGKANRKVVKLTEGESATTRAFDKILETNEFLMNY